MRQFAQGTSVSVEKTKGEIEALVSKAGADAFASASKLGQAMIQFKLKERVIRFGLPLPDRNAKQFSHCGRYMTQLRARSGLQSMGAGVSGEMAGPLSFHQSQALFD